MIPALHQDISGGRDFFALRVPWPLTWFAGILTVLAIVLVVFAWWAEIDVIIKAKVILRPERNISTVKNAVSGPLVEKGFHEGQTIRRGDLLWRVNTDSLEVEWANARKEQTQGKARARVLEAFGQAMKKGVPLPCREPEAQTRTAVYFAELKKRELGYSKAFDAWDRERALPPHLTSVIKIQDLCREKDLAKLQLESYPAQTFLEWEDDTRNLRTSLQNLEKTLTALDRRREDSVVKAPVDGVVEALKKVNQGDYLLTGEELVRIVPVDGGSLKAEIVVDNRDIASLTVGMSVTYLFTSLPPSEYGAFRGRILRVPSDAEKVSATDAMTFILEGSVDKTSAESRRTGLVFLRSGMTGQARILLTKKSLLRFVLEKLDFL